MLSDSLDPDQDLQSGSKLFTWYDVCGNVRGGISSGGGGGDYVLVVKFSGGGGLCPSCKIHRGGGDYVLVVKFMGDFVHIYKNEQGGFSSGGGGGDYVRIPIGNPDNKANPQGPILLGV